MNYLPNLTLNELQGRVRVALRHWHREYSGPSPLEPLRLFQQLQTEKNLSTREATNQVLFQGLQLLEERHEFEALLLRRSDLDKELAERVANDLNMANSTLYRHKKSADHHLAEVLLELEQQAQVSEQTHLLERLDPPSCANPVGLNEHLHQLQSLLTPAAPPWIVVLAGISGIGKTTLADAAVRQLAAQGALHKLGWVTARHTLFQWDDVPRPVASPFLTMELIAKELCQQLTGELFTLDSAAISNPVAFLRRQLKAQPHLIVIDNLDTVTDVERVLASLREFVVPSKFLLTSCESLFGQPDIYQYAVRELSPASALHLVRQEAQQRNLTALQHATDAELLPILKVVGGNPLALRLLVGETYVYSIEAVLDNLIHARGAHIENLYRYIYHRAWAGLDEAARHTLLLMSLTPYAGADLTELATMSELLLEYLVKALEKLVRFNLVYVQGDLHERRYAIHNLTRTFLLTEQVLRWQ
jgi:hypothetical protein